MKVKKIPNQLQRKQLKQHFKLATVTAMNLHPFNPRSLQINFAASK